MKKFEYADLQLNPDLYPHQVEAIKKWHRLKRFIYPFPTGGGKTAAAVESLRLANPDRALIICPSVVKEQWSTSLNKWWPKHPPVGQIFAGRTRSKGLTKAEKIELEQAYAAPIQIVSPELLHEVDREPWDFLIVDEAHRFKTPGAKCSQNLLELARLAPDASMLALTATLIPNEPTDIWNILDILYPNDWGKRPANNKYISYWFANRYSNKRENQYGIWFEGINQEHVDELRSKLARVSHHVRKEDIAHLYPAVQLRVLAIRAKYPERGIESFDDFLDATRKARLGPGIEWVTDARQDVPFVCVLTHLRETARVFAEKLGAACITGDDSIERRHAIIEEVRAQGTGVLVATMHSIGEGIDSMSFFDRVLFAEMHDSPKVLIQAIGRFPRIGGAVSNVLIDMLAISGSDEERKAHNVANKQEAINAVFNPGKVEESLAAGVRRDPSEIIEDLALAISSADTPDELGSYLYSE